MAFTNSRPRLSGFSAIVFAGTAAAFLAGCPAEDDAHPLQRCTYDGNSYAVGATFPADDGCNACACVSPGSVACTTKACPPASDAGTPDPGTKDPITPPITCTHDGKTYEPNQSFPSTDGCNTCTCIGGHGIACTTKACPPTSGCRRTGCSGHVCADQDVATTCEWKPEYACYQKATCARQPDGTCGFTPSAELTQCLKDSGTTCDFSTSYDYGDIGGLRISVSRSYLMPHNSYRHTRTAVRGEQADVSCSPALPACGAQDVITAYDIEVHDLPNADVQAALKASTPPFFGRDLRPVDGTVFEFRRADGRGFLVGADCATADCTCVPVPAGIKRLKERLRALDAQQLASPECRSVGVGG